MIHGSLLNHRQNPKVLVENKISFAGPETELSIYDTFEAAELVSLQADQLLFCGMVTGKKVMHNEDDSFTTPFLPHESFVMAPKQRVQIDFPEARLEQPTTCLAIEISVDKINQVVSMLNQHSPIDQDYGMWQYDQKLLHTHHNTETQALLNRIVQIYTEPHPDRSMLIDLAISELTVRLLREQAREFIIRHSEQIPDCNGLNAAIFQMSRDLALPLDIDELCKISCMSRTKFFEQFKRHLGCTPVAYQQQMRLKQAAKLIRQGKQITQVCFDLGFVNASHFSRSFKHQFGMCPTEYRQRNLQS